LAGVSGKGQICKRGAHIAALGLVNAAERSILRDRCGKQDISQRERKPQNRQKQQIYDGRKQSSPIKRFDISCDKMFVILCHGKYLSNDTYVQYNGIFLKNQGG
jgi:hypothetical protein